MKLASIVTGAVLCTLISTGIARADSLPLQSDWPSFTGQQVAYSGTYTDVIALAPPCLTGPLPSAQTQITGCSLTPNGNVQFVDPNTSINWNVNFTGTPVTLYEPTGEGYGFWWGEGYYGASGGSFTLTGPNGWTYSGFMINGSEAIVNSSGETEFGINFDGSWGPGSPTTIGYFYFIQEASGQAYLKDFVTNNAAPPAPAPEPSTLILLGLSIMGLLAFSYTKSSDLIATVILRSVSGPPAVGKR